MKKILCLLLAVWLLTLCGCNSDPDVPYVPTGDGLFWETDTQPDETLPEEKELMMMYYPNSSMNPLISTDVTNRTLFSLIYQSLFVVDDRYNVSPVLCQGYRVSPDMRMYTFYVAEATFSDGTTLTPEDVYATYTAAMENGIYSGRFEHVYRLTLEDDGGICFRLDTPIDNFPLLLDVPILKASEINETHPVGTGPYVLEETTTGARLRRRIRWWCSAALPVNTSSIPLLEAESPTHIRDSFEFSNVGLVCADPSSASYADYRCDYEQWDCENGNFLFLACNLDSPVFSNVDLRSAITYAIDRNSIASKIYRGFARSTSLAVSPQSPYYNDALAARYEYNPELFAKAVQSVTLPKDTPIILLVNKEDTIRLRVVRNIQDSFKACGMDLELLELDQEDYLEALEAGEYDLYLGQTRLSANMDLSTFFSPTGNITYGGMADSELYSLCLDSLANRGNYYNLHAKIATDGRLCPILFQSYSICATRGLASDLSPSRDNIFYYNLGLSLEDVLLTDE